jgi:hypothetical protein
MRMMHRIARQLPLLMLLLIFGNTVAKADNEAESENLYLEALKAISEKRNDDAKAMLSTLIEKKPLHAGAWLDLAMLQCKLGNKEEADKVLLKMKQNLPLSEEQLYKLELWQPKSCIPATPEKRIAIAVEAGYDTNVNQGASNPFFTFGSGTEQITLQLLPEYQPKADRFAGLSGNISQEINNNGTIGFAQARLRSYDSLSAYNTLALALGVEKPWKWRDYGIRGTALVSALSLGGTLYQKQEIVQLRLSPAVSQGSSWRFSTMAGFTNVQYPTLGNFDAHTWELRGLLSYETQKYQLQAGLAAMADRAHADRQGGHRTGYYGNLNLRRQLSQQSELELGWSKQIWQSAEIYSPNLIDVARRQDLQLVKAGLNWYFTDKQSLQLEFRAINNKENISILQYNSKSVQLSWQWQNF